MAWHEINEAAWHNHGGGIVIWRMASVSVGGVIIVA